MQRLGLALSGGGFRGTLYHLGVVRFLRDAGILSKVTHITSVSGGSIIGAHLALNWDKYTGSEEDFDAAASEIVRFVQLDVRNRIVRRFPFASVVNIARSMCRLRPARQLSRAGLLEKHYEKFLFGDVALSQLPRRPQLHVLSTNLSEGCLCSFNRQGLVLQRRAPGRRDRFERVDVGLATVPMAVAASSAFPGFFPPLELSGWEVGADEGEFSRQAFTDGGVYDNLGLRMFRCIEQSWVGESAPLTAADFLAFADVRMALKSADALPAGTPLRRLREMLESVNCDLFGDADDTHAAEVLAAGLWGIIQSQELYRDTCLQNVELNDPTAQSLLGYLVASGREPEVDTRLWLNRQIIEAAMRQVIGKPCLRLSRNAFGGILVSDAGGKFKATMSSSGTGLVRTALRASDILMDRVWQLELEAFENTPGVVFFPITETVDRSRDRTALDKEVQRQAARIRTDLDAFTEEEISALVRHGYGVARNSCAAQNEHLKAEIPRGAPWDPIAASNPIAGSQAGRNNQSSHALQQARRLQKSSRRKVWTTLFDFRDWPSYVWLVLVVLALGYLPYVFYDRYRVARQHEMVVEGLADMNPNYETILELLDDGPEGRLESMPYEKSDSIKRADPTGFETLTDTRIFDLRGWGDPSGETPAMAYTRSRVRRIADGDEDPILRLQGIEDFGEAAIICDMPSLKPRLARMDNGDGTFLWQLSLDFETVPVGGITEFNLKRELTSHRAAYFKDLGQFNFGVLAKTNLLQVWVLLPPGREYESFEVSSHPIGDPEQAQVVVPHSMAKIALGSVSTFRIIDPKPDHEFVCRWRWRE